MNLPRRLPARVQGGFKMGVYVSALSRQVLVGLVALLATAVLDAAEGVGLSVVLEARVAASRGVNLLLTHQRADGSWAGDAVATAQVLICLENAPDPGGDPRRTAAIAPAVAYLRRALADGCAAVGGGEATSLPVDALAAALTALARDGVSSHRALLVQGRACLLGCVRPLDLPDGTRALAFAARRDGPPEPWATCAALDGLLVTADLEPAWTRAEYSALTAPLRERLRALSVPGATPPATPEVASGQAMLTAALVRALLCLGVSPAEPIVAGPLASLAQAPPRDPAAAFALAEALSLARADAGPLAGWRERLLEVLLGAQQGDGGWPAANGAGPRDGAIALALRALQVAAGRQLVEAEAVPGSVH